MQRRPTRHARCLGHVGGFLLFLLTLSGCGADVITPPPLRPSSDLLWALRLNHHAAVLSPLAGYDTLQLRAIPYNADGVPLTTRPDTLVPGVVFSTLDTTIRLQPDGLVRASSRTPITGARVIASLSLEGITVVDTCFVVVTAPTLVPNRVKTFTFARTVDDSAKIAHGGNRVLSVLITDSANLTIAAPVYYWSSQPQIAVINRSSGAVSGVGPGAVTFYATSHVYGTTVLDSFPFRIGQPIEVGVRIRPRVTASGSAYFFPETVTIGRGGIVNFANWGEVDSLDVEFETPSAVAGVALNGQSIDDGGNIAPFPSVLLWRTRRFPVAGTYRFHSRIHGASGTVIVVDESH